MGRLQTRRVGPHLLFCTHLALLQLKLGEIVTTIPSKHPALRFLFLFFLGSRGFRGWAVLGGRSCLSPLPQVQLQSRRPAAMARWAVPASPCPVEHTQVSQFVVRMKPIRPPLSPPAAIGFNVETVDYKNIRWANRMT